MRSERVCRTAQTTPGLLTSRNNCQINKYPNMIFFPLTISLFKSRLFFRKAQLNIVSHQLFAQCFAPRPCKMLKCGHMLVVVYIYHMSILYSLRTRSKAYRKNLSSEQPGPMLVIGLNWLKLITAYQNMR